MHDNYHKSWFGYPCSNTIAGLKFALAMWVPYIHDNLQLFNSETYTMNIVWLQGASVFMPVVKCSSEAARIINMQDN